ncbi:sensor domain-containing diguanylate cyclase [Microbacterium atlanticum]|uniref:sensor domain-containing diguanylate cyclase n=1 Tax=Microbacterium atlanticum TaxID=2782168 RepID=UPI0018875CC4|nr:sensor domain-containing diguanylate cyclase [Microbacterium atlanticum]
MSGHGDGWFEHAPCGLVATTPGGDVVDANGVFLTWMGHAREDVVGRPFASLLDAGSRLFYETRHTQVLHLRGSVEEVALTLVTADGTPLPTLVNSARDEQAGLVRMAVFKATERAQYERELLAARRTAETSEQRVRVLQDVSSSFDVSATDEEVAESFAAAARDAFAARDAAVYLTDDDGELQLKGGTNPLAGKVAPVPSLRNAAEVTVVNADEIGDVYPELAAAMRAERLSSITVTPLLSDGRRLGNLACFFARRTDFDAQYFDLQQALGRQASQTLTRVRLQRRLAFLALHDQLTGVANRQLLQLSLDETIAASAAAGEPLAVLFLDVDDFKSINDAFGHASGDMVLFELAARLTASVRVGDLVGRIGGDEFVAICARADAPAAEAIAERILEVTRAPITVAGGVVSASVSVGISLYLPGIDEQPDAQQLLVRADAAMYSSKRTGKNRLTLAHVGG